QTLAKWIDKGNDGNGILEAFNLNGIFGNSSVAMNRQRERDDDDVADKRDDSSSTDSGGADSKTNADKSKPELKDVKNVATSETITGDKPETKTDADALIEKDAIKLSSALVNLNVKVIDQSG